MSRTSDLADILAYTLSDDSETLAALKQLSDEPGQISVSGDFDVDSFEVDLDCKLDDYYERILAEMNAAVDEYENLALDAMQLHETCDSLKRDWTLANAYSASLLAQVDKIEEQKRDVEEQMSEIDTLLGQFTLAETDIACFSRTDHLDGEFFTALGHLRRLQKDCAEQLVPAGFACSEDIQMHLADFDELADTRLLRGAQLEFRTWDPLYPEASDELQLAVEALRQRPILFQSVVEDISRIRREQLADEFSDAVFDGPRSFMLHAHEPIRFCMDVVSWVHLHIANEVELWQTLLGIDEAVNSNFSSSSASRQRITNELDRSGDGLTQFTSLPDQVLLRAMIDASFADVFIAIQPQVQDLQAAVATGRDEVLQFKLAQILLLYSRMVRTSLGYGSMAFQAMDNMAADAFDWFLETLRERAEGYLRDVQTPDKNLLPPSAVSDTCEKLGAIVDAFESSMIADEEVDDTARRIPSFDAVVGRLISPVIQMCDIGSFSLAPRERSIYMLNCLHAIILALGDHAGTAKRARALETETAAHEQTLVRVMFDELLIRAGLFEVARLMDDEALQADEDISKRPESSPDAILVMRKRVESFLLSPMLEIPAWMERLSDGRVANTVIRAAAENFVRIYAKVYERIANDEAYQSTLVGEYSLRTPKEIETIVLFD